MPKYNFTIQHLYGKNHKYITKILNIIQATKLEEAFIKSFYSTVPMKDLSNEDCIIYAELAKNAFNFYSSRKEGESKVRIYSGDASKEESDHTIIEIICDEMPFIFDSAMSLLNRHHINIDRVAHPNIHIVRNNEGDLVSIEEKQNDQTKQELLIQIRTLHVVEEDLCQLIEKELNHILVLVTYSVADWKETLAVLQNYLDNSANQKNSFTLEEREFLNLVKEKYFVFFGSCSFSAKEVKLKEDSIKGIFKEEIDLYLPYLNKIILSEDFLKNENQLMTIGKLAKSSVIHREANIDYIALKKFHSNGELEEIVVFVGLFTSILYYQSATLIPIIREKLMNILTKENYSPSGYVGKEIISLVEALPRDELFQIQEDELHRLIMEIYALLFAPELRLFIRKHSGILSCLLFLPLDIANSDNLRKLRSALSFEFGNIVTYNFGQINSSRLCYYYFMIDTKDLNIQTDLLSLEQELRSITRSWEENLKIAIFEEYGKNKARDIYNLFSHAFPLSYQESNFYRRHVIEDIENIILSIKENKIIFKIIDQVESKNNLAFLKIYFSEELNLFSIMPMIQNLGFNVVAEQIFLIKPNKHNDELWLHQFALKLDHKELEMLRKSTQNLEEAFYAMWEGKSQDDPYNQLILRANLSHRQVILIRAFVGYLYQIKIGYSKEYIGQVLNKHFKVAKLFVSLFYYMFDPKFHLEERNKKITELNQNIDDALIKIEDNIEDQVIRRFMDLINNILRTNYFLKNENYEYKEYISFKINSEGIPWIPLPKPYREIYSYSSNFEAVHLRGGKVARGGIRWSDRQEDYRTEVLGLMKTQIVKNSVIVPTGAKGGFILKNIQGLDRDSLQARAIECYKNFLSSMLDITDNIISGKTHHPKNIVKYDHSDSYLVVAADKGTATFSDIANKISQDYGFWLGDAFASGGSKGYDHKKMGITAKGAWISVVRHFHELGIDIEKEDFTVIGIGDMSGDVFGNGMLLSRHIRLLAAFNHMHIFIDPNPDSVTSYAERERLFNLPRSSWKDYDEKLLSKGGMIYERRAKFLELTPEIKARFKINADNITPEELIRVILTSEADLLWNGGIGTYVKASFETHEQVGDKTNDNLRCNGSDLRVKIVGEGGNLGFTQYGRIEYARNGGRLNTDAIDNSAGVDCSDHEVNIKIVLEKAIENNKINEEERVELLENMTDAVAALVLKDNLTQTRALTIAQHQGYNILSSQEHFIDLLEEEEILDRKLECLPSKQQFLQMRNNKESLTRPELSVLLAYSKNSIYNKLIETSLAEEEYFFNDLLLYFPESMRDKFADIIAQHPLRKEIIITSITNSMVNRVDTFYLHLTSEATGHKFSDIARAYTVTRDLFGLRNLWKEINGLDGLIPIKDQVKLYIIIKKFVMRSTNWLLRNYKGRINISSTIDEYKNNLKDLYEIIADCATGKYKETYYSELDKFRNMNVPEELAKKIAILNLLTSAYNIVEVANRHKTSVKQVASVYFELGQRFSLDWLRYISNSLATENNWQKLAVKSFKDELYDLHRKITSSAVDHSLKHNGSLEKWFRNNGKHIKLFDRLIAEVKAQRDIEYAMIDISLKKLSVILSRS